MRASVVTLQIALLLLVAGCIRFEPSASAPRFHETENARPGFATLYIYRPYNVVGHGVWPVLFINGKKVVGLKDQGYTVIFVKPGKYKVRTGKNNLLSGMGNIPGRFEIPRVGTYFLKFDRAYMKFTNTFEHGLGPHTVASYSIKYERWTLVPKDKALPEITACCRLIPPSSNVIYPLETSRSQASVADK